MLFLIGCCFSGAGFVAAALFDFAGDWKGGLHNIEMFNIRGNTIGDVGAKALAQAFQLHHAIRVSVHVGCTFVRSSTDQNMNIHMLGQFAKSWFYTRSFVYMFMLCFTDIYH